MKRATPDIRSTSEPRATNGERRRGRLRRLATRGLVAAGSAAILGYAALHYAPLPAAPAPPPAPESTKILDRDGRVLYDATGPDGAHFTRLRLDEIPVSLREAVIATEDASFYGNSGVSLRGVVRAAFTDLVHRDTRSGGSTITQQLARNLYFDQKERSSNSASRKMRETMLALRLDRSYTKDEILELYLNRVYFGNLAHGIEAASRTYFGKSARDLDLAESAMLAGLLQSPSDYDPFARPEAAAARQHTVLGRMVDEGYLTADEAAAAIAEPLAYNTTPFPIAAPHFVAWIRDQLPTLVGDEALARGVRVTTSLDLGLQQTAQQALVHQIGRLTDHHVTNGAVVVIDPTTGQVLAMVGSADYFDASIDGAYNAAVAERQPGSAIKPVIYAAALEAGFATSTPLLDVPTTVRTGQGDAYTPSNYDLTFHGVVPLREALASSYNVPAVRTLASVGVDRTVDLARRFGLMTLRDPARYDLSLALGGGEVRLLDLTSAYAALAAGGTRLAPVSVLRIEDAEGNLLYDAPAPTPERVVSAETAYLLSDVLSDNDARAPAFGVDSVLRLSRPAAVKTGTTTDFRDNWTVGYTPDVAVGVWVGNADNSPMLGVSGVDGAAPVWRDVMETALASRAARGFVEPPGMERVSVCLPSGLLPTAQCARQRMELFAAGTAPTEHDDYYRALRVCEVTGAISDAAACPGTVRERVFAFVPVEAIPWAREAGVALPPVPPYSAASGYSQFAGGDTLKIVSPADGVALRISRDVRTEDQRLRVEAQPTGAVRYIELYIDARLVGRADTVPYRASWQLVAGEHVVRARAVDAAGNEVWSEAVRFSVWPP
jgi:1A family penicillin-binding protein